MSFGLQFNNNQGLVTLDSEFARLVVMASGRYSPNGNDGYSATVYFDRPVTSQARPLLFVRPDTINALVQMGGGVVLGSPGNWTGVSIVMYNKVGQFPNGRFFVATFGAQAVSSFGMRLWDAGESLLFDSGTPCAVFTRAFQNWNYVTYDNDSVDGGQGYTRIYYSVPFDFPEDEYLLLTNFAVRMCSADNIGRSLYSWWDFQARKLWAVTIALSNPYAFFLPAVFAKINT